MLLGGFSRATVVTIAGALAMTALTSRAQADEPATNRALAEALFREGRERMTAKDYAEACPKLAESQRIDPQIGTLLNLAFCHTRQGRTATAWGEYSAAAAESQRAGRKENEASARAAMKTLEEKLSRVVIVAKLPPPGLTVKLDGATLGSGALGSALPVDPGPHVLEAAAPDRRATQIRFEAAAGPASATLTLPELTATPPSNALAGNDRRAAPAAGTSARRSYKVPIVLGGVAVASAVVGTIFGLEAFAKNREAGQLCGTADDTCNAAGLHADSLGRSFATVSTVTFIVAGAAAASSVVWLLVDKPGRASASVGIGPGSAVFEGRF